MKDAILHIRVTTELKNSVDEILKRNELTLAAMVRVLMNKISSEDSINFLFDSKD